MILEKKSLLPFVIVELANTHGGCENQIRLLIEKVGCLQYSKKGIKFQIFHPDLISLPDFPWYSVYTELFFEKSTWCELIQIAATSCDVWIDIFDTYSVEVVEAMIGSITGVKIQASVLGNREVLECLKNIDLKNTEAIINVSGYSLDEISSFLEIFSEIFSKVIIQVGFQDYPTHVSDTGILKLPILKSAFPGIPLAISDHADANFEFAKLAPAYGFLMGCEYIEKHFCIDRNGCKYDGFSSLEPTEMVELFARLEEVSLLKSGAFINVSEKRYLEQSRQVPVLKEKSVGSVNLDEFDFVFRRTGQKGLDFQTIIDLQSKRFRVKPNVSAMKTLNNDNFREVKVGVVVAARLKSTRLPEKALVKINGRTSIELCLEQCLGINGVDTVVLATSNLPEDSKLLTQTCNNRVMTFCGDPNDVISRYLQACEEYDIDVVIRVTGDCPVLSTEIAEYLLEEHFKSGADFTAAAEFAVGTACEIIEVSALQKVSDIFGIAQYSEYMSWYFTENQNFFKVNFVDLPDNLVRGFRLTLDHPEDLEMFYALFEKLKVKKRRLKLAEIFSVLDSVPSISDINRHCELVYKSDHSLIALLKEKTKISNS